MRIVIKAITFDHAFNRMHVAGLKTRDKDDEGRPIPCEYMIEHCVRPPIVCADGQVVFVVDVDLSRVDKIPEKDSPNFDILWREDQVDEEGRLLPYPSVEVDCEPYVINYFDDEGNWTHSETFTTRIEPVGRIV